MRFYVKDEKAYNGYRDSGYPIDGGLTDAIQEHQDSWYVKVRVKEILDDLPIEGFLLFRDFLKVTDCKTKSWLVSRYTEVDARVEGAGKSTWRLNRGVLFFMLMGHYERPRKPDGEWITAEEEARIRERIGQDRVLVGLDFDELDMMENEFLFEYMDGALDPYEDYDWLEFFRQPIFPKE